MTRVRTLLLTLVAALAIAGCGEKREAPGGGAPQREKVTLVLDYFPNADHAGIYAAQATGAFARAGLDVTIRTPGDPSEPLKLVAAGKADIAISYEPELFFARDKGIKVVGVGALAQRPLTSLIALGSAKVTSVADLRGKTVGTAGIPYQSAYLRTILTANGVDPASVKEVNVGFNLVSAMLSKKVDATLGGFWNYEAVQLARAKKKPTVIRMDQAGVPTYDELVLVARQSELRTRGFVVRRLLQALRQGAEAVRKDPATGVDPLLAANPDVDRGLQTAAVQATLPVFFPADPKQPFGWQDPAQWQRYGRWLRQNGLLTRPPSEALLTNEFLPGEGVAPSDANAQLPGAPSGG